MMAARRQAPPPPTRMQRVAAAFEQPKTIIAAVTAFWLFASLVGGSVYSWAEAAWRHYTGAELAYKLAPEVQELRELTAKAVGLTESNVERLNLGEQRLKKAERTLEAAQVSKTIEQERTGAVETAQRSACLTRELSADACHRLGYPTEQR